MCPLRKNSEDNDAPRRNTKLSRPSFECTEGGLFLLSVQNWRFFMKKFLSLLLVACMVLSLGGITAFADDSLPTVTDEVSVIADSREINANVAVTGYYAVYADNNSVVDIAGSVSVTADAGSVAVIGVEAGGGSNVEVGDGVSATAGSQSTTNVATAVKSDEGSVITVTGDVTAVAGNASTSIAIGTSATSKGTIVVNGNVTANKGESTDGYAGYADGVFARDGGTVAVNKVNGSGGNVESNNIGVDTNNGSATVEGDVSGTNTGVKATGGGTVSANSVTSTSGTGVDATANAQVNVTKGVSAGGTGIVADNATVTAGSVGSEDHPVGDTGVEATATGAGSVTTVTVGTGTGEDFIGGGIYATGWGVYASSKSGGETTVKTGDITSGNDGVLAKTGSFSDSGTTTVTTGDITSGDDGVHASSRFGGTITVSSGAVNASRIGVIVEAGDNDHEVEAVNITVTAGDIVARNEGVDVIAYSHGEATVSTGDIKATSISNIHLQGVNADADGGKATVNTGDITAEGRYPTVGASASVSSLGGEATVNVGNVTAYSSEEESTGAEAVASGGTATVNAESLSATGNAATGINVLTENDGTASVNVVKAADGAEGGASGTEGQGADAENPAVKSDGTGISVENRGGTANVTVEGDVEAGADGVVVSSAGTSDVFINGTLSADQKAVVVDQQVTEDNLSLTVWKIETKDEDNDGNADDFIPGSSNSSGNSGAAASGGAAAFTDSSIQYIIRVEQPTEGLADNTKVTAEGANNSTSHGYNVANEGETVTIKVTVKEGYKLTGAFNGEGAGRVAITEQDKDGNYYIIVPKGGGLYLSVTLEEDTQPGPKPEPDPEPDPGPKPEPDPESDPEPKPESVPIVVEYASVQVTFNLDGGSLNGETGTLIKWFFPGQTIKLPDAPVKKGFSFVGWETTVKGEKVVFQPGVDFTVTDNQSFIALWKEA